MRSARTDGLGDRSLFSSARPPPQWKGRSQSPDTVATLPQLASTASRFRRFRVSGAAPVRRLPRNEVSEKLGTIQFIFDSQESELLGQSIPSTFINL